VGAPVDVSGAVGPLEAVAIGGGGGAPEPGFSTRNTTIATMPTAEAIPMTFCRCRNLMSHRNPSRWSADSTLGVLAREHPLDSLYPRGPNLTPSSSMPVLGDPRPASHGDEHGFSGPRARRGPTGFSPPLLQGLVQSLDVTPMAADGDGCPSSGPHRRHIRGARQVGNAPIKCSHPTKSLAAAPPSVPLPRSSASSSRTRRMAIEPSA
jgi:hypothetical protein